MAEQNLPWIPSPQSISPRTERTTWHHDDSRKRIPLYSQVLTSTSPRKTSISSQKVSHHTAKTSVADRDFNDVPTMIQSPKSSSTKSTALASPRLGHESLPDISKHHKRGGFIGAPISTTNSPSVMHDHKVQWPPIHVHVNDNNMCGLVIPELYVRAAWMQ